jgi:lysophospholipase L1-like esterase
MRPAARRLALLAAVAVTVGSIGLVTAVEVQGATTSPSSGSGQSAPGAAGPGRPGGPHAGQPHQSLASCEQHLESSPPPSVPRMAVVGASFTAGVGSSPGHSWAAQLAGQLHWNAVIYGVPGAGYVRPGVGHGGPMMNEVARAGLHQLSPSMVIVQAGHDDIGVPASVEQQQVTRTLDAIHAQAPSARIVLLTVFAGKSPPPAAYGTDQAIISAARSADQSAIIIDPLTGKWTFPHISDGLHPSPAGASWIAHQVATALRHQGVPAGPAGHDPVICHHP